MVTCEDIPNCNEYGNDCNACPAQSWLQNRIDESIGDDIRGMKKATKIKPKETIKETEIKDSGERREFNTGAVRDIQEGKGRYDLLPWDAIHELAIHCEEGALKYGERNCEKGIPIHSLIDSAIRHLSCYLRGMKDEPHLRAAMWNVAMAIWTEKKRPEMQDIPVRLEDSQKLHGV